MSATAEDTVRQVHESTPQGHNIIPRTDLDFGFDEVPKYWFEGNAFKTRFFDAMSLLFPEGEKFFIECVRDYRDQVEDPELKQQIKDFTYQEGQHGMVHTRFNNRLKDQGIEVDRILDEQKSILRSYRQRAPKWFNLSLTVAAEHMTAIMAHSFMHRPEIFENADPRMRALYVWHGIEEIEHKGVAFDVLQKIAKANYFQRIVGLLYESILFPFHVFMVMNHMLKVDGVKSRWKLWFKGLWWLYGPGGVYMKLMPHYFTFYLPGFHPWKYGDMKKARQWLESYERDGDPIAASEIVAQASS